MAAVTQKPILISGAGLASLLFAQGLRNASVPFQIFESDASMSFRAQGYRLRLSAQGLDAIESVLSPDHFKRFWDVCGKTSGGVGGGVNVLDALTGEPVPEPAKDDKPKDGQPKGEESGAPATGPPKEALLSRGGKVVGISRGDMRKVFMEGCEPYVHWSHKVTGYEKSDSGVRAIFADGSKSDEGALLVAGDGIYSKVAKQVSGGKLKTYDTGARGIHGQASTTAFKGLGEGVWRIVDESRPGGRVFVMTNVRPNDMDDPDTQFGWTMGAVPGTIKAPNDDYSIVGEGAARIAKDLTAGWHPRLKPLFDEMNVADAAFWKITCSTPSGVPEWDNDPRVTVIGDAAHSMTPAGGIGANTAVRDSALLGSLIAEAGGFRDGVTAAYEAKMRVYGSEAVKISYGNAESGFGIRIDENSKTVN